jgi:hypothetical protein
MVEEENAQMFQFIPSLKHEIKLNVTYMHGNGKEGWVMTALAAKT